MTQEEKKQFAKLLRQETGCGMMEALKAIEKLQYALKHRPLAIMDNPASIEINWIYKNGEQD